MSPWNLQSWRKRMARIALIASRHCCEASAWAKGELHRVHTAHERSTRILDPLDPSSFWCFERGALHLDACHWCNGKAGVLCVLCFCVFNNKGRHVFEVCQVNRAVAAVETWARSDTRLCQTIPWCLCVALTMFLSIEAFTMSGHTCQVKGNLVLMLVWEALNLYSLNFFVTEHCMLSHEVLTDTLRLSCTLLCYTLMLLDRQTSKLHAKLHCKQKLHCMSRLNSLARCVASISCSYDWSVKASVLSNTRTSTHILHII